MSTPAAISVRAWKVAGILLEHYTYTSGAVEPLPKHVHEDYQFGLSFDCQGEYTYRGAAHAIPPGSLSAIHSGEVHAPSDRTSLPAPASFWMMHVHPALLHEFVTELAEKPKSLPFFASPSITDSTLNRLFLTLQHTAHQPSTRLEQETALHQFFFYLIANHAANRPAVRPLKPAPDAVERARDYLHSQYARNISLEEMAAVANLSQFHFCRVFRQAIGLSPGAYQTQLQIAQAKKLLVQGLSASEVAVTTGFYDQSHLSRHFKRLVGVTPRRYIKSARIS
ncbi:AraC family transcriptional regulator [Pseudanabaena sp. FACHB-2040]|uniref:AraC family transcriptional regulator n=1 Tax=Pseudanabaena sp. FACHB-2040 TaxID=2692859 RepID=UPI0016821C73|nr:AraC family transcriptional regulator [Pseudanabaena sp. FACHB-2040]MBD2257989.1 helix-turn-helix transcriptional regulator [Pseudanabaena sp. FACHB-2040]